MIEQLRDLLYPLGYLSAFAFSARFLCQWLASEMRKESVVPPLFWRLSLVGNLLLLLHSIIQVQFHVCFVQTLNAIISFRHLNLMQPTTNRLSLKKILLLLIASLTSITALFTLQSALTNDFHWFHSKAPVLSGWHLFGFASLLLFSSRFWVQWWLNEKHQTHTLGPAFWWLSITGNFFCILYFYQIKDPVNLLGPLFQLIPCIRNLILLYKRNKAVAS